MDHNDEVIGGRGIGVLATPNVKAPIDHRLRRANALLLLLHVGNSNSIRSDPIWFVVQE